MTIAKGRIELEKTKKYFNEPTSIEISNYSSGLVKGFAIATHTVLFDDESWIISAYETESEAIQEFVRQTELAKQFNSICDQAILYKSFKNNKALWIQYARLMNH